MESYMVNQEISNIYDFQSSEEGLIFLKENIEKMFPVFTFVKEHKHSAFNGFGVVYIYGDMIINLGCERNALTHLIEIGKNRYTLYKFDDQMKQVLAFSRKNILFTLFVLSKVIEQKNLI